MLVDVRPRLLLPLSDRFGPFARVEGRALPITHHCQRKRGRFAGEQPHALSVPMASRVRNPRGQMTFYRPDGRPACGSR
jgi:hypothetical protein